MNQEELNMKKKFQEGIKEIENQLNREGDQPFNLDSIKAKFEDIVFDNPELNKYINSIMAADKEAAVSEIYKNLIDEELEATKTVASNLDTLLDVYQKDLYLDYLDSLITVSKKENKKKSVEKHLNNIENIDFESDEKFAFYVEKKMKESGISEEEIEQVKDTLVEYNLMISSDMRKLKEQDISEEHLDKLEPLFKFMEERSPEIKQDFESKGLSLSSFLKKNLTVKNLLKTGSSALMIANMPQSLIFKAALSGLMKSSYVQKNVEKLGNVMRNLQESNLKDTTKSNIGKKIFIAAGVAAVAVSAGVVAYDPMMAVDGLREGLRASSDTLDGLVEKIEDKFGDGLTANTVDQIDLNSEEVNEQIDRAERNITAAQVQALAEENLVAEVEEDMRNSMEVRSDEVKGNEGQGNEGQGNEGQGMDNQPNNPSSEGGVSEGSFLGQYMPQNNYWGAGGSMELISQMNNGMDINNVNVGDKISFPVLDSNNVIVGLTEVEVGQGDTVSGLYEDYRIGQVEINYDNTADLSKSADLSNPQEVMGEVSMDVREKRIDFFMNETASLSHNEKISFFINDYLSEGERETLRNDLINEIQSFDMSNSAATRLVDGYMSGDPVNARSGTVESNINRTLDRYFQSEIGQIEVAHNQMVENIRTAEVEGTKNNNGLRMKRV